MIRLLSVLITGLTVLITPCFAADVVWPGWLGPDRNGWVDGFEPPEEWPETLSKVWQIEVGTGYGSPLVANGRVFQHARQGEEEVLWCFDLNSGDAIWRKSYEVPFKIAGGGDRHGKGPKSCPVYADGRVFTMSLKGHVRAWDAETGDLLWRSTQASQFEKTHPNWGASTSPIVDGEKLIAHFGTDAEGALTALDVATGDEIWSLKGDGASYSSPLLAELEGVRQVVNWNHKALVGVDSSSGKQLWSFPFPHLTHNQNMPTPTLYKGSILLGGENRGIRSLTPKLKDGVWSVEKNWKTNDVALDMSTAVINGDLLFGMSHYRKGCLFCLDAGSGEVLWQGPGRTAENVTFLSIPGSVVALASHGELRVVAASGGEFQQIASWKVGDDWTWSPPVLMNGKVLIKDRNSLILWSF